MTIRVVRQPRDRPAEPDRQVVRGFSLGCRLELAASSAAQPMQHDGAAGVGIKGPGKSSPVASKSTWASVNTASAASACRLSSARSDPLRSAPCRARSRRPVALNGLASGQLPIAAEYRPGGGAVPAKRRNGVHVAGSGAELPAIAKLTASSRPHPGRPDQRHKSGSGRSRPRPCTQKWPGPRAEANWNGLSPWRRGGPVSIQPVQRSSRLVAASPAMVHLFGLVPAAGTVMAARHASRSPPIRQCPRPQPQHVRVLHVWPAWANRAALSAQAAADSSNSGCRTGTIYLLQRIPPGVCSAST